MECMLEATERVGKIEMAVVCSAVPADADRQYKDRGQVLAAWLLAEWERQQKEAA